LFFVVKILIIFIDSQYIDYNDNQKCKNLSLKEILELADFLLSLEIKIKNNDHYLNLYNYVENEIPSNANNNKTINEIDKIKINPKDKRKINCKFSLKTIFFKNFYLF